MAQLCHSLSIPFSLPVHSSPTVLEMYFCENENIFPVSISVPVASGALRSANAVMDAVDRDIAPHMCLS